MVNVNNNNNFSDYEKNYKSTFGSTKETLEAQKHSKSPIINLFYQIITYPFQGFMEQPKYLNEYKGPIKHLAQENLDQANNENLLGILPKKQQLQGDTASTEETLSNKLEKTSPESIVAPTNVESYKISNLCKVAMAVGAIAISGISLYVYYTYPNSDTYPNSVTENLPSADLIYEDITALIPFVEDRFSDITFYDKLSESDSYSPTFKSNPHPAGENINGDEAVPLLAFITLAVGTAALATIEEIKSFWSTLSNNTESDLSPQQVSQQTDPSVNPPPLPPPPSSKPISSLPTINTKTVGKISKENSNLSSQIVSFVFKNGKSLAKPDTSSVQAPTPQPALPPVQQQPILPALPQPKPIQPALPKPKPVQPALPSVPQPATQPSVPPTQPSTQPTPTSRSNDKQKASQNDNKAKPKEPFNPNQVKNFSLRKTGKQLS